MHQLPAPDDAARCAALSQYQILDTPPDPAFDDLVHLAAQVCATPIAAINLIDAERQWFKARVGIEVAEVPRALGCCPAVIGQTELVVVPDLAQDVRFAATPVVMAGTPVRFYAGMPLRTAAGDALGTLFVADVVPRQLTAVHAETLRTLARQVVALLELHRLLLAQHQATDQAVHDSAARFRTLVQHSSDSISILDAAGTIQYQSPAIATMQEYAPDDLVGTHALALVHPDDVPLVQRAFQACVTTPGATLSVVCRARHRDGSWRYLESVGTNHLDNPAIGGIVVNTRDITERRQAEAALEHQALYDPLTGLPNRTLLCDRLTQAIEHAKRHPDHRYAVLFLDLDRFKVVNDSLGHPLGDQLLRMAARRLAACVRADDTVARLGGDEFVVLLDGIADVRDAVEVAERIQATLAESFDLAGHAAFISASIGITLSTCAQRTADAVLRDADSAMYRAKNAGKAQYAVFDAAMHAAVLDRLHLEAELRQAIAQEALVLHYQPIVAAATGMVVGLEALVRWPHPTRGQLPPAAFIPVAEETGLILALGAWVLRTACAQLAAWQAAGLPSMWVAVNLSVRQVQQPGLPTLIADTLAATGLAPHCVQLEITESMLLDAVETTRTTLAAVHALGVRLALDDFGMGYSSLRYLQHLPLDTLKLAQPFVEDIVTDPQAAAISAWVIALGTSLGLTVIAEGVETPDQVQVLRAQQCDAIQGYLISHPLPATAVLAYLQDHAAMVPMSAACAATAR
jgi:diguanylate cyclase (GGDEF)-like protein/PAS domain S-box-containing protein